jgi:isoquinoline 1-oxidoreductase beta subunit
MIEAQMEGGIVFGLTAALKASINFKWGRAQETNFNSYPLLRMDETPLVEVHIVPSTNHPSGVGEMSNPVIMPAVANAIFATTGKRVRRVPIRAEDLLAG